MNIDEKQHGKDLFGDTINPPSRGVIADKFSIPPFTVLSARDGYWQDRKRAWIGLGIESELGRGQQPGGGNYRSDYGGYSPNYAKTYNTQDWVSRHSIAGNSNGQTGTSIFDPVLTELCYTWFCPPGGQIIDPFAGGSVRGIVAGHLGFRYWGCDLRAEQIEANRQQGRDIVTIADPEWVCGDSLDELESAPDADFVFSCPPYGNLEKYSDDPRDLSSMEYHTFIPSYKRIILRACKKLTQDRFACFVVGDFRDKKGNYQNFVSDTIAAFREQGLHLYNEAILLTCVGSLPIRISKQFEASRKLGKTHQNILVFVKGDGKAAAKYINSTKRI